MAVSLETILDGERRHKVENDGMAMWDKGVFVNELQRQGLALSTDKDGNADGGLAADEGLAKGSYKGTQLAVTEVYSMIEEAHVSQFDSRGFEPIIPLQRDLEVKKSIYQWSDGGDFYPPHLNAVPEDQKEGTVGALFNAGMQDQIGAIAMMLEFLVPKQIETAPAPYVGPTIADCEKYNRANPSPNTDIMEGKNIGFLDDWYSDARFAQQHLSGVNPTTIETAPPETVKNYADEAGKQGMDGMKKLLSEGTDILIQDYSYFRKATHVSNDQSFKNMVPEMKFVDRKTPPVPTGKAVFRYTGASVIVFQLHEDGRLHPLAITLDYKGSLEKSITIFNRRLNPDDKGTIDEKDDWPWRYAKTVAQTADWARHEIAVHLNDTHLIEEAIIVATNRTVPEDHIIYEILSPHWFRTLALNAAARKTLVPAVIARLAGFGPTIKADGDNCVFKLLNWHYENFNFQEKYIPNDLKKRGFDLETQSNKYRNYPYASCMFFLWGVIRNFVQSVLDSKYKSDKDVQDDSFISDWCKEIQANGKITTFPTITTRDQLVDAVTMCIHTASPQHTAVNYLQDYYYSFVPAKPAALCTPLPADLKTLQSYTEKELTAALPIGTEGPKWKDWLLAAQLPELLSYKVDSKYNLINYAKSLYNVNRNRTALENKKFDSVAIRDAAALFYSQLKDCELAFEFISASQTEGTIEYKVLQPELTAVSILI